MPLLQSSEGRAGAWHWEAVSGEKADTAKLNARDRMPGERNLKCLIKWNGINFLAPSGITRVVARAYYFFFLSECVSFCYFGYD